MTITTQTNSRGYKEQDSGHKLNRSEEVSRDTQTIIENSVEESNKVSYGEEFTNSFEEQDSFNERRKLTRESLDKVNVTSTQQFLMQL